MTARQIGLHLGGLFVLIALLGGWYWQSTGERAVPAMTESLRHEDAKIRIAAAQMLASIGPAAKPAVPVLLQQALNDPVLYAGTTAAEALAKIDLAAARQVMTANLAALRAPDPSTRRDACAMLGSLGPVAKPAVPALAAALDDDQDTVRMHAVGALGEIGIPAALVIPALTKALHDRAAPVRHRALAHFAFSVPPDESVTPHLKDLAEGADPTLAQLAKSTLASPHRSGKDRAAVHLTVLRMGNASEYTLHQLAQIVPGSAETVPAVIPVLKDKRPLYRYLAAEVLGAIGPGAREAVPALTASLQDEDTVVRESAADALRAIGGAESPESAATK